jgi:hypothetical protein
MPVSRIPATWPLVSWPVLRKLWGYGCAAVLVLAVAPYPVMGVLADGELIHRIHDTVGAVHYLLLWAPAVVIWSRDRTDVAAWNVALVAALAMVVTSIPSGDLIGSMSWAPLITLVPLWPSTSPAVRWWRPERFDIAVAVTAAVLAVPAVRFIPDLIHAQTVSGSDVHGARFHYGGMAGLYVAVAACALVVAVSRRSTAIAGVVGVSALLVGVMNLQWPEYDSAIDDRSAWAFVVCGVVIIASGLRPGLLSRSSRSVGRGGQFTRVS